MRKTVLFLLFLLLSMGIGLGTTTVQAQTLTVLHRFTSSPDGAYPYAGLVRDAAGNLYGTTYEGGSSDLRDGVSGYGTVFKLDTSGTETVLHRFTSSPDGAYPYAGLVRDAAGNLYGTTSEGGSSDYGTVFKLDTSGNETVLHNFTGGDGSYPYAGLVRDATGNLYGTTLYGGASGVGTVFKLDTSGNETVLHNFTGGDGAYPYAGLVRDATGNLYGTTFRGGSSDYGTVFKLDTSGTETVLHSFTGYSDGSNPRGGLVMDAAGNLYGTTEMIGEAFGTVFKLAVTPQAAIQSIINQVQVLLSQGVVNSGQAHSLVTQLQHAIQMINAGKTKGAIGNLKSFISEVNDLLNSGVLSSSQAAALTSAANSVIAQLL
jgi:uncharacterized repeat protein (TIGR03803 family)